MNKLLGVLIGLALLISCAPMEPKEEVTQEFVELGKQYQYVAQPFSIGGKLGYEVDFGKSLIVFDEKEYGHKYAGASYPADVGGKLAYSALSTNWIVVFEGEELGKQYEQIGIDDIVDINGKPGFPASYTRGGNHLFFWNGTEYGQGYAFTWCYFAIEDKLACYARIQHGERMPEYRILFGDQELGNNPSIPVNYNGKLAYIDATDDGKWFVVIDGVPGKKYDYATHLQVINNKLAFVAKKRGKEFVVYDGKEGRRYANIQRESLISIDGKLAYTAGSFSLASFSLLLLGGAPHGMGPAYKYFIVYDGKEIGHAYSDAFNPMEVRGKLAYQARNLGKSFVVYEDQKLGKQYGRVWDAISVGNRIAYAVEHKGNHFVVLDGVEGKHYDQITIIRDIGGKLAYRAEENNNPFIVLEK